MVTDISGIPGSGKNVLATFLGKVHYKHQNNIIRKLIRKVKHEPLFVNNVYSTYPILLKKYPKKSKHKNVYSKKVTIYDLVPDNRFENHACIIIDEAQAFYDSEEHKIFPKEIATFNQFHRHFGIDNIYYITQHPSRLLKKLCVLASQFIKVKKFIKIPILNIGIMHLVYYYERDDYGKYNHPKKEAKNYDVKNKFRIFKTKPVFKSYDSKYLRVLNEDKPLYDKGEFDSLSLSEYDIKLIYRDKLW